MLPKTIKLIKIWSDGPNSQFKNKFIAAIILLFQNKFGIKIVWNYFATAHGKGIVDGLGAVIKKKVRRLVMARERIVNCASDFVNSFNSEASLIDLIEMSKEDIDKINNELKLVDVFRSAPAIKNISKLHQLQVDDNKIIGFCTSEEGYKYLHEKKST